MDTQLLDPEATFPKDPDAVGDFKIDWADYLKDDTIASSTWAASDGITIDRDESESTLTKVWLSGGVAGNTYFVMNRITTNGGRTDDRTLRIQVRER